MSGLVSTWFSSPKIVCKSRTLSEIIETKSGFIILRVEKNGVVSKNKLFMKVFKQGYEHSAQIFTDDSCCYMYGWLSLRKCVATLKGSRQITIQTDSKKNLNQGLSFEAESDTDASEWIETLTPTIPSPWLSPSSAKRQDCVSPIERRSGVEEELCETIWSA
ncbi:hypothetical protein ACF0H5_018504 [Mactra antiquata]